MRVSPIAALLAAVLLCGGTLARAQLRTIAVTVDDLPFVTGDSSRPLGRADIEAVAEANSKLLAGLARHRVPVTGFVNQEGVAALGPATGRQLLREWTTLGFDLGNHTFSHADLNDLTVEQFEDQIVRGEAEIGRLMQAEHRRLEYFRFPFNHTGNTQEKHDQIATFLAKRGYKLAPCTIETEDWAFNAAYFRMRSRHDDAAAARLRADYLAFTAARIDYYSALDKQVFGYDVPQIMLIHANQLNADTIEDLIGILRDKRFMTVSLTQAEADPAYQIPETYITQHGPMWGYRWAQERGVKVDGSEEPEPPSWIAEYGRNPAVP
jgi:peptidoglycan/xylan/chitin deacetylase (PgdA/CDA1 family)